MSPPPDRTARDTAPEGAVREIAEAPESHAPGSSNELGYSSGSSFVPSALTSDQVLRLQRQVGNQAVQRMLSQTVRTEAPRPVAGVAEDSAEATQARPPDEVTRVQSRRIQRWDWGGAGIGAGIGAVAGGLLGGPLGAVVGGLIGGAIGGLVGRPTVDPKEALKKAAESLTETGGTGTESDRQVVIAEMVKIPLPALEALKKKGTKVVVCRNSVTEIREDLKGVQPRGWPAGKTWDSVPGLNDRGSNRVIIATRAGRVPAKGDGHGSHNLVLHEVGHAIGEAATVGGEGDARFIAAREKDKAKLDSYEGQAGSAGVEETYAESFARFYGNDPNDATTYPNLHAYWASSPFGTGK